MNNTFEVRPGNMVLFEVKKKSEKAPDFQGTFCDDNGNKFKISGWSKRTRLGNTMISCKVQTFTPDQKIYPQDVTDKYKNTDDEVPF